MGVSRMRAGSHRQRTQTARGVEARNDVVVLIRSPRTAGAALFALIGVNFERHTSLVPLDIFEVILKHHVAI